MIRLPLALLLSGCSFLFTARPETPACTVERTPPIVDTVVASLATVALGVAAGNLAFGCKNDSDNVCSGISAGTIVAGAVVAAVTWPSAIVGWNRAARCEELHRPGP